MEPIVWKENMAVNIDDIDEDHRVLVAIVNKLAIADNRNDTTVVHDIINELVTYARTHFEDEEQYMLQAHYPSFDFHRGLHDKLTMRVLEFRAKFHDSKDIQVGEELYEFASHWLATHILTEDVKFGQFFATRGHHHR
ncbi:MAG TPA: bacteriohemerythrin [Azospirillaceae bacterium]|nr:bacteriohemerythrin [Azospirillaceae bacterium]